MQLVIFFIVLLVLNCTETGLPHRRSTTTPFTPTSSSITFCPDHYWRDYNGQIPPDAIEAGRNFEETFYVGQGYFQGKGLLPVSIFPEKCKAVGSALSNRLETDSNIKILCSPHKHHFHWIQTQSKNLSQLSSTHLITGGSEVGETLYIGRATENNKMVLGKNFKHPSPYKGLWIPVDEYEKNYLSYEVLTYTC